MPAPLNKYAKKFSTLRRAKNHPEEHAPIYNNTPKEEKAKFVEVDINQHPYLSTLMDQEESDNVEVGADEVGLVIDSLTEQRNDAMTKNAVLTARIKNYQLQYIQFKKVVEAQITEFKTKVANLEKILKDAGISIQD